MTNKNYKLTTKNKKRLFRKHTKKYHRKKYTKKYHRKKYTKKYRRGGMETAPPVRASDPKSFYGSHHFKGRQEGFDEVKIMSGTQILKQKAAEKAKKKKELEALRNANRPANIRKGQKYTLNPRPKTV